MTDATVAYLAFLANSNWDSFRISKGEEKCTKFLEGGDKNKKETFFHLGGRFGDPEGLLVAASLTGCKHSRFSTTSRFPENK